ncbi:HlyD family secretion protein, partial [Singulisphaera rosea]
LAPGAIGPVVESGRSPLLAGLSKRASRKAVDGAMQLSARVSTGVSVSPHVLSLTRGVLKAMPWTQLRTLAIATLAIGLVSGTAGVYVFGSQEEASSDGPPSSSQPMPPEGRTPTSKASAEGPAPEVVKAHLNPWQYASQRAKLVYEIAKLNRELAELDVIGYEENFFKQELQSVLGEIGLAEAECKRAEDRLEWSTRMKEKKYVSKSQNISDEVALQQKRYALEQAETKRAVLEQYTKGKTIKELRSNLEKARLDELTKQHAWDQEKSKELEFEHKRRKPE